MYIPHPRLYFPVVAIPALTAATVVLRVVGQSVAADVTNSILQLQLGALVVYLLPRSHRSVPILLALLLASATILILLTPFIHISALISNSLSLAFSLCTVVALACSLLCAVPRPLPTPITLPPTPPSPTSTSSCFPPSQLSHEKNAKSISSASTDIHTSWEDPRVEAVDVPPSKSLSRSDIWLLTAQLFACFSFTFAMCAVARRHVRIFEALNVGFTILSTIFILLAVAQRPKVADSAADLNSVVLYPALPQSPYTPSPLPCIYTHSRGRNRSLTRPLPVLELEQVSVNTPGSITPNPATPNRDAVSRTTRIPLSLSLSCRSSTASTASASQKSRPKRAFTLHNSPSPSQPCVYPSPPPSPELSWGPYSARIVPIRSKTRSSDGSRYHSRQVDPKQQQVYLAGMAEMGQVNGEESEEDFRDLRDPFASSGLIHPSVPVPPPSPVGWNGENRKFLVNETSVPGVGIWGGVEIANGSRGRNRGRGRVQRMSAWGRLQMPVSPPPSMRENRLICKHRTASTCPSSKSECGCQTPCTSGSTMTELTGLGLDVEAALLSQKLLSRLDSRDGGTNVAG